MIYFNFDNLPEKKIPNLFNTSTSYFNPESNYKKDKDSNSIVNVSLFPEVNELYSEIYESPGNSILTPFLPGFLNWILKCPSETLNLLELGGEVLSEKISHDNITLNPLGAWISEHLESNTVEKSPVGNSNKSSETLYGNYYNWAMLNNISPISKYRFSDLLMDNLIASKWPGVTKKKFF